MKIIQLQLPPEIAGEPKALKKHVSKKLGLGPADIFHIQLKKRSIDARQKNIKINLQLEIFTAEEDLPKNEASIKYRDVSHEKEVIIVGAGPAGLFAALKCLELGKKPVVLERGKNVKERIKDIKAINTQHIVNPDSNYCFGEGGAGTYSDGKLYTRSKKRGDRNEVLNTLVRFGASEDILIDAHPHVGSNKLPAIITAIKTCILNHGGEIHLGKKVNHFLHDASGMKGLRVSEGDAFHGKAVILATGHSARDIYETLSRQKILIEAKPFAIGVRIEHPQSLIDQIQYHVKERGPYLPPAAYRFVQQIGGRGVYSFCMCPGGVIAPCATGERQVVTNGWSASGRSGRFANAGIVVELKMEDFINFSQHGELRALEYQRAVEERCWLAGGETQVVPAQRMTDFCEGRISAQLPKTSYPPGVKSSSLFELFPANISEALTKGLRAFGRKSHGYYTAEAVLHAPESRTSSPVRIPRDMRSLQHPQIAGLFPCGEGAGYAGGIVSAAIDGILSAVACCKYLDS
ncbi:MAG: FAD-dependent protein [Pseudomonadota bacterium]